MKNYRKLAIFAGAGFILAIIFGAIGLALTEVHIQDLDFTVISNNENSIKIGAMLTMFMSLSVMMISLAFYPVLKKTHPSLALGYVGLRFIEGFIFIVSSVILLTLITLSKGYTDISFISNTGRILLDIRDWLGHVSLDMVVFSVAALILYYILYKTRLVPRWLSIWGLAASIIYMSASYMVLFGFEPLSPIYIAMNIPLALNEIVLGIILIAKGFNRTA
ncbi:MAG: DUF4386 domain-containing protein [Tenericutes bacterium]|nr:DUF4386 domain-containing protein [Mycoplasmatota bacterium]